MDMISTADDNNNDEEAYPTGSTVPFPYGTPYPQQVGLMDALLTCLKMRDEEERREQQLDGGSGGDWRKKKEKKRAASVLMLESPTGTGKSLSLACASVSWLRHRERLDLALAAAPRAAASDGKENVALANDDGGAAGVPTSSNQAPPPSSTASSGLDWIDSWASPDQIAADERSRIERECVERAEKSRALLQSELDRIRSKLARGVAVSSASSAVGGGRSGRKTADAGEKEEDAGRLRTIRENLARSAVTAALVAERKRRRRKVKNGGGGRGGKIGGGAGGQRQRQQQDEEADFCLDEYRSDDGGRPLHSDSSDDDSSDDENDLGGTGKGPPMPGGRAATGPTLPSTILDGGSLDGSAISKREVISRRAAYRPLSAGNGGELPPPTVGGVAPGSGVRKIIYAARTHSQLSQFVGELRRTAWGSDLRVAALGGRKLLCGNGDVLGPRHRSEANVTERCLDLQKGMGDKRNVAAAAAAAGRSVKRKSPGDGGKAKSTSGCPLLASREAVSSLALHALARPSDIEDLAGLGTASNACAYYASRESVTAAEVVVAPYNTLLSTQARNAVGLSLQNSLVIIDEAHNIPEALRSLSSCRLSLPAVKAATEQLSAYTQRYASRLAGRNLFYLGQLRRCLVAMTKYLIKPPPNHRHARPQCFKANSKEVKHSSMMSATELLFALKLDNLNLFKVLRYLEKSRLAQKLLGFVNVTSGNNSIPADPSREEEGDDPDFVSKHVSSLSTVQAFLACLTGSRREGKVVVDWPDPDAADVRSKSCARHPTFRYVLLNPAAQFNDVLDEAYAVVLAGGTLRPFSHVAAELMGGDVDILSSAAQAEVAATMSRSHSISSISPRLATFTCGHVIPSNHVHTACLSVGPTGTKLDFRHASRTSDAVCDELGRTLLNISNIVPAGFVVFLPSYSYEAHLMRRWGMTGLLDQVKKKKRVYREPKNSRDVEAALESYSRDAVKAGGAILFSVVGGKMSEGINFANDMARCVLVVGLPYPDITDPEMQEKMRSLDKELRENKSGISGQSYYHNLCMRAVNQSIGRAIRHSNDYASVVLADARYASEARIWRGLPKWLRGDDTRVPQAQAQSFGKVLFGLRTFFKDLAAAK